MPQLVEVEKSPYGLSGGTVIAGGIMQDADAYVFYPVDTCYDVSISFSNIEGGPLSVATASIGVPIYGAITSITMSGGTAILYSGSYYYPLPV